MKTVLIIAYACNPNKHSEHRVGFETLRALVLENPDCKYLIFTRKKNVESLEASGDFRSHVIIGFDLHRLVVSLKSFSGLTRSYYYLWSVIGGVFLAFWLNKHREKVDLIHHLTFVCDWLPSAAWFISRNRPFIFGPVGSNDYSVAANKNFASWWVDLFKRAIRSFDVFTRLTYSHSDHVYFITETVSANVSKRVQSSIYPAIGMHPIDVVEHHSAKDSYPVLLFVGRLMEIKRPLLFCDVAKRVAIEIPSLNIVLVGEGPLENEVLRHEIFNDLSDRVSLIRSLDHVDCIERIMASDVLLFTSYEQAGLVGLEALACKTFFVCSERGFLGARADYDPQCKFSEASEQEMVSEISQKIIALLTNKSRYEKLVEEHYKLGQEYLWREKAKFFHRQYDRLVEGIA